MFYPIDNLCHFTCIFPSTKRPILICFLQYILGKYFSAPTGEEQIRWLLGPKTPNESEMLDVQRITVHDFNASVKLFRKGTYLDMYEEFSNRLLHTNTDSKFSPVMAHFFLLSFDSTGKKRAAEQHRNCLKAHSVHI